MGIGKPQTRKTIVSETLISRSKYVTVSESKLGNGFIHLDLIKLHHCDMTTVYFSVKVVLTVQ